MPSRAERLSNHDFEPNPSEYIEEILAQLFGTVGKEFKAFPVHRRRQLIKSENTLLTPMDVL